MMGLLSSYDGPLRHWTAMGWMDTLHCRKPTVPFSSLTTGSDATISWLSSAVPAMNHYRVELHCHLDGAIRPATIWELSKKRNIDVGAKSLEDLESHLEGWETGDLRTFLDNFTKFMPAIVGCTEIAKRIAYELCEDLAQQGVVYAEIRYNPHLLANSPGIERIFRGPEGTVTPRDIVRSVNEGVREGTRDFGIQAGTILCMIREKPEWSLELLELAKEFHNDTVVGLDIANNEMVELFEGHVEAFKGAVKASIHRTVHAGEVGPASGVRTAIEVLGAERIGHGYHIVNDVNVLKLVKEKSIHLEVCPSSSLRTGALKPDFNNHVTKRFIAEDLDFSINTDDPTLFTTDMTKEIGICRKHFEMDDKALARMTLNAAKASFLPDNQRKVLVRHLEEKFKSILES